LKRRKGRAVLLIQKVQRIGIFKDDTDYCGAKTVQRHHKNLITLFSWDLPISLK
jgi:hypothetical protein